MRTHLNLKKGFTLIELLVVIAIIGILAGIVLVSLGSARNKGKDAAVQEEMSGLRAQMEIFFPTGSTYVGGCVAANNILTAAAGQTSSTVVTGTLETTTTADCNNAVGTWVAQAPLTTSGTYWCVDSTGASKSETVLLGAAVTACA